MLDRVRRVVRRGLQCCPVLAVAHIRYKRGNWRVILLRMARKCGEDDDRRQNRRTDSVNAGLRFGKYGVLSLVSNPTFEV